MKRRLFAHERELQSWRSLTLTTHRVIHFDARHGLDGSTSIPLPHIQWTRIARSHQPRLVILAGLLAVACLLALWQGAGDMGGILLALAGAAGVAYLSTRRAVLVLASGPSPSVTCRRRVARRVTGQTSSWKLFAITTPMSSRSPRRNASASASLSKQRSAARPSRGGRRDKLPRS